MNDFVCYFNEEYIIKYMELKLKLYDNPENLATLVHDIRKEMD